MSDLVGHKFGPYEITAEIGHGGMANVYRAIQPSIGREVAIKVLPRQFSQDPTFLERFNREVKVIAHLQHPHILAVHDYGEQDGQPYIVMAYMPTGTLSEAIRASGRGLPLDRVVQLVEQIASALDYAHDRGIVHRDFKPSNVLLDAQGNAYLADFGIAKVADATVQLTGSGIVGTPAYIAPEMAAGSEVTRSVDLYALGVTLFEMLTGQLPFDSPTPIGQLMAHINNPVPDVCVLRPDLPAAVQQVVSRAMAKSPDKRYQSAGALAAALRRAAAGFAEVPAETAPQPDTAASTLPAVPAPQAAPARVSSAHPSTSQARTGRRGRPGVWIAVAAILLIVVCGGLIVGLISLNSLAGNLLSFTGGGGSPPAPASQVNISTPGQTPETTVPVVPFTPQGGTVQTNDTLEIVALNFFTTSTGALWFVGQAHNTGNAALESVSVTITLRDGQGGMVGTETGYVMLNDLLSGETAPFVVLFADGAPGWQEYEVFSQGDATNYYQTTEAFEVTNVTAASQEFLGYTIEGEVRNTGQVTAQFIRIVASVFDAQGTMLGAEYTFCTRDTLAPGESSPFDLTFISIAPGAVYRYELIVQGSVVGS